MTIWSRLALATLSLSVLLAADGCPFTLGQETGSEGTTTTGGAAVDVGGSSGALWQVLFEEGFTITVRAGGQVAAKQSPSLQSGLVTLLGGSLDAGSFCLRSDVVCPHQVLPGKTAILQGQDLGLVAVSFNRRGPFASLPVDATGLAGQLDGKELMIPLAIGDAAQGSCALGATSLLAASASAESGSGTRADTLRGRITVSYDGACVNLGGSGAFDPETRVELSMGFAAKRQ